MAKKSRFDVDPVAMEGSGMTSVITDKETGVQYLLVIYPNLGSGMSVLVDADGQPLLKK
ncbi:DUF6440 family protein [Enterococcus olivae]